MSDNAKIVVSGGPYIVSGDVPVVRSRHVVQGRHPVGWEDGTPVDTADHLKQNGTYWLCRCGHSKHKPFCDVTHREVGFDGPWAAAQNSYDERAEVLGGTGVEVRDDRSICAHAGFCAAHRTNVWAMVEQSADDAVRDQMVAMIDRCPSGALTHRANARAEDDEPDHPVQITVEDDGPLVLTGGIEITGKGGEVLETRNRVVLSRCGHSGNKPLCDGSHAKAGFQDS